MSSAAVEEEESIPLEEKKEEETEMTEEKESKDGSPKKRSAEDTNTTTTAAAAATTPDPSLNSRSKRARKSTSQYVPQDFSQVDRSASVIQGTGVPLGMIAVIRDYVESVTMSGRADLYECYKLLFHARSKPTWNDLKARVLEFNGCIPKDADKTEQAQAKEKLQERMWKFQVAALRRICNTLQLDRSGKTSKEELMELLLAFLSKPHAKYTKKKSAANNASKKKKAATPKKTTTSVPKKKTVAVSAKKKSAVKTKITTTKQKASSLSLSTDDTSLPSAAELDEWVHAYVIVFDTQHVGMRHAWEILQAKFGFDNDALPFSKVKALKNQVKEQLMDAMEARANKNKKEEVDEEEEEPAAMEEDEKEAEEEADDDAGDADAMDVVETNETDAKEEEPESTERPDEDVADEEEETGADTEKADDEEEADAKEE